ncbi:hypothetical protein GIB67_028380, partial [Kingdonia uniflora]
VKHNDMRKYKNDDKFWAKPPEEFRALNTYGSLTDVGSFRALLREAEDNPLNDYPDEEETSEDESEDKDEEKKGDEEEDGKDGESRGSSDEMIDVKSVSSDNEFDYNSRRYYNHAEDEVDL